MRTFTSGEQLSTAVGEHLGTSEWLEISQDRINAFADATGDHQWIHVDVARAATESPYGAPIAHGFLSLSLVSMLNWQIYTVDHTRLALNYGTNKVRFISPVTVGARVRLHSTLTSVTKVDPDAVQVVVTSLLEIAGEPKPALVADLIGRYIF